MTSRRLGRVAAEVLGVLWSYCVDSGNILDDANWSGRYLAELPEARAGTCVTCACSAKPWYANVQSF